VDEGKYDSDEWIVSKDKEKYNQVFYSLNPKDGKLSGAAAKSEMVSILSLWDSRSAETM